MRKIFVLAFVLALVVPTLGYSGQTHGPGSDGDGSHGKSSSSGDGGEHPPETTPPGCSEHCTNG